MVRTAVQKGIGRVLAGKEKQTAGNTFSLLIHATGLVYILRIGEGIMG
ncbi:hypothetical protein SAMN04488054_10824 [Salibacterium qingdaonense]|uniref:Uncharacterized protein n=1 Tax=Salibacterium qingdaonense TaxID=266892 RepID=A0A1I4LKJ5_9BACI|nr:hypothetical protein SAMN04488054_10824 [Salibacterium qingdaonense]